MSYRGEDLDLRTPQSRGPREGQNGEHGLNGTRGGRVATGRHGDAIYVDDTVLACCNHAFGVAQANGASEVRLEHLVHALTRVEAAAGILEDRGIREAHLRRESGAVISSEIPVGLGHTDGAPRSSSAYADVLGRASDLAQRRGVAATVHDLLWVLLNYDRDIPAIGLLLRHATDWQSWEWPHQADTRQPVRTAQTRPYVEPAPPPPRFRSPEPSSYDPVSDRLDQLDGAMRKMQSDMAADRRALTDLVRDLQRDIGGMRHSGGGVPAGLMDRLRDIETAVDRRAQDFSRTASALSDRLQAIEKSLHASQPSGLADLVTEQLITVTSQVQAVADRMKAIEEGFATQKQAAGSSPAAMQGLQSLFNERFQTLRQTFEQQNLGITSAVAEMTEPLSERLRMMDTQLHALASRGPDAGMGRAAEERLGRIEQSLATAAQALAQAGQVNVDMHERIKRLETQAGAQAAANAQQAQAVAQGVQSLTAKLVQVEALVTSHGDRSVKYAQQLAQTAAEAQQRDLTQLHDQLVTLGSNQRTLAESLDQWRTDSAGDLGVISNRMEALEKTALQPSSTLKQIQDDIQGLSRVALADFDQNKRGVRNWLFGTTEIFAGSWRDETRQLRDRLKQLREERKA
jgi:hypothetical protein